jgi:flagellar biosynthesis protein FliQ
MYVGTGTHRRPTFAERAWAYRNYGLLVLAAAVASGLITGAFIAIMQAVN